MAVKLSYFVHGTTEDNINHVASGQADAKLSELGIQQGKDLGVRRTDPFDAVFASDLSRAVDSAKLAFDGRCPLLIDKRLRECDYGDWTQKKKDWHLIDFIDEPYPNGESYIDVEKRIKAFLDFLKKNYDGKHVAIMAHQAPQLAIEVILLGKSWPQVIEEDWRKRKEWQPGWEYTIE